MDRRRTNRVKSFYFAFLACAVLFLLPGCAETRQFKAVEQICVTDADKVTAMQQTEEVLGKMHFTIEKSDVEQGLIRTRPLAAAQAFEFWRSDNVGAFNNAEANLHSIRRTVEVNVSQQAEKLCIGCNVKTQKLNLPESQISSSSQAYSMFSKSCPSIQKLVLNPTQKSGMCWVDLGQDNRLAAEILNRIEKKMRQPRKEKSL